MEKVESGASITECLSYVSLKEEWLHTWHGTAASGKGTKGPLRHLPGKPYCRDSACFLNLNKSQPNGANSGEVICTQGVYTRSAERKDLEV